MWGEERGEKLNVRIIFSNILSLDNLRKGILYLEFDLVNHACTHKHSRAMHVQSPTWISRNSLYKLS